jgi:serine protease AprX
MVGGVVTPGGVTAFNPEAGGQRFKVRFPDRESFLAGQAAEGMAMNVSVCNDRRNFLAVELPGASAHRGEASKATFDTAMVLDVDVDAELSTFEREYGAKIVEDYRYALEEVEPEEFPLPVGPATSGGESLDDVLRLIGAEAAWETSRGAGVTLAVVDTGINGTRPEFEASRRRGGWAPGSEDPWSDYLGHGTMCACIGGASRVAGGEFDGVAPLVSLVSCRTRFFDSELATIYDYLGDLAAEDGSEPIIASNSFGINTGSAPQEDPESDFLPALAEAISAGVTVCFSAGNYHGKAGGAAESCEPNSIWTYKCRDDVIAVAASRPDGAMWDYSSRGPGQFSGQAGMSDKPDVSAPTPPDGVVLYGDGPRTLPAGWGTSGACPQVAGLLALLVSAGHTAPEAVEAMVQSSVPLGVGHACEGAGVVNCVGALEVLGH